MSRPTAALVAVVGGAALALALRSVVYPVALTGLPALVIALTGHNPLPKGGVFALLFTWTAVGMVAEILREDDALPLRVLLVPPVLLTLVLTVWLAVRLPGSRAPAYADQKLQLWIAESIMLMLASILIGRRADRFRTFVIVTLAVAAASAAAFTVQLASGHAQAVLGGRYALSSAYNPIEVGRTMSRGLILSAFVLLGTWSIGMRLAALAVVPTLAVSFVASGSRGPVLGLLVGLLVLLALAVRDRAARRRVALVFAGLVVAAALVPQLVPGQNISRSLGVILGSREGLSSNGRYALWNEAWNVIGAHPLFGIGTGSFADVAPVAQYPHNIVLEAWAELGVVGLLLVVGVLVAGSVYIAGLARRTRGGQRLEVVAVAALWASSIPNALVSGDLPNNYFLWLSIGLAVGMSQRVAASAAPAVLVAGPGRRDVLRSAYRRHRQGPGPGSAAPRLTPPGAILSRGAILSPAAGAVVGGTVFVSVEPAVTGWDGTGIRLEAAGEGEAWLEVAMLREEAFDLIGLDAGGRRHHLAVTRTAALARTLAAELERLAAGFTEFEVVRSRRRPWQALSTRVLEWDTTRLPDGEYRLRAVTSDAAGSTVESEPVSLRVDQGAAGPEPAPPPATADAWREVERARVAVESLREELEGRAAALDARLEAVARREAAAARIQAEAGEEAAARAQRMAAGARPPASPSAPEPVAVPSRSAVPMLFSILERYVELAPHEDPFVQEKRQATLLALREYVDVDGTIPQRFERVLREVFPEVTGES